MQLEEIDNASNLVSLFLKRADQQGDAPFLTAKRDGTWQSVSYADAAQQVCIMAENLRAMGLHDGDRVIIISENRPEWCISDLAIMAAGCITTPAYTTNTQGDHSHILDDSGARAVVVSGAKLAKTLFPAMVGSGHVEHVIAIDPIEASQAGSFAIHDWASMIAGDAEKARESVEKRMATTTRDDLSCIIYTSGTSGAPRGVMLHHGALLRNIMGAGEHLVKDFGWKDERFLSFLPLSHALEHTAGLMLPIGLGADIWFAQGLDKLSANLAEAKPSFMIVVPRLFEILRDKIIKQVSKQGRVPQYLLNRAMAIGEQRIDGKARLRDWPMERVLDVTLRPKMLEQFGGNIKALVSGGAPLNPEVGGFFQSMGLTMLQGYGQTETAPVVACNFPSAGINLHTVGPAMRGVEVDFAADGEILVRGECVMKGYWQNEEATKAALPKDWLHTGDIGHLDDAGRLVITDRKKDIIVNDKGDNIAPQKLEGLLTLQTEIAQAMVAGDKRPYIVGLIIPDDEWMKGWAKDNGQAPDLITLKDLPEFHAAMREAVNRVNKTLSVTDKIRKFTIGDEAFTVNNDEMTPTLKIRRHQIKARYGERLDSLY